ncbi:unnamed protein product [Aphanomyces euteiches]|uniref:RING-type domain-containing protein n=1 Tax=Aphanomyces euteiches TaxID=100861 RepID=A0A6G0X617_9STRA|nr:hypothetical protein Ae201684_008086 [Aphanomyces euteiches]KAH9074612.1 hypothetical protein Ae201684P_022414 [Aphanomyces euteiches]KAH9156005.1 hypothetical protein AeRB84_002069 [Aphanomyces euteiches]
MSVVHEVSSSGINVRLSVSYPVPDHYKVSDVLAVFRSAPWVHVMVGHVVPYLKSSSPAKKEVLQTLIPVPCDDEECVICMAAMELSVALACGHHFHLDCITTWLSQRSTCPTCRFQYQNEFSGRYAFKAIDSALVWHSDDEDDDNEEESTLYAIDLGGQVVQVTVHVALMHLQHAPNIEKYPCVLKAGILREHTAKGSTLERRPTRGVTL